MEAEVRRRLADLRGMLSRSLTEGRRALQAMLDGLLQIEPNAQRRYDIRGTLAAGGALFTTESVPSEILPLVNALEHEESAEPLTPRVALVA